MIRSGTYRVYLKHIMFVLLMIAFSCYTKAISAKGSARPKVAITICGGGANDFSHIGLIKVLEEEEVPYDIILGTSMGGIFGRSYAIGHGTDDLREIALSQNWQELLSDSIPRKDLDQVSKMNKQRYVINLHFDEDESAAKTREINIGMRLNSRSATSVILNSTSRDPGRFLNLISITADLSNNPKAELLLESHRPEGFNYSLTIEGMYKYLKMKPDRGNIAHTDFFYYSAGLHSSQKVLQCLNAGLGIKGEYYAGQIKAMNGDAFIPVTPSDEFFTDLLGYLAFDNLDDFYFPCNGREIYAELSFAGEDGFREVTPILLFKMRNIFRISNSFHFLFNLYNRNILSDIKPGHLGTFIGGNNFDLILSQQLPFYGLPEFTPSGRFTLITAAGLRLNIRERNYFSIMVNNLTQNQDGSISTAYRNAWGIGLGYSYRSKIGPIEIIMGYSDRYKRGIISGNIGYWF